MPTPERAERQPRQQPTAPVPSALSMKDLLASCAAATAVSTPPSEPEAAEDDVAVNGGHAPDSAARRHAA
ncbi:hypothetical protein CIB93_26970 [Streptomyces sp. WZ.A104]|uniref:hypothetical protein n=1 Tax=Streptomyces sp. WZ.A104 TaxID=2023771 RepID=UPI000BBC6368|nr:hypothetical protein [Streptomyces sp. WZ.A104]PCG83002.1 hypothetical protein CIB93_26970 [Streptomyces sp. WZ.A104]